MPSELRGYRGWPKAFSAARPLRLSTTMILVFLSSVYTRCSKSTILTFSVGHTLRVSVRLALPRIQAQPRCLPYLIDVFPQIHQLGLRVFYKGMSPVWMTFTCFEHTIKLSL